MIQSHSWRLDPTHCSVLRPSHSCNHLGICMGILYSMLSRHTASSHDIPSSSISPEAISHPFPLLPRPRTSPSSSLAELPSARIRNSHNDSLLSRHHHVDSRGEIRLVSSYTPPRSVFDSGSPIASFISSGSGTIAGRKRSTRKLRKTRVVDEGWDLVRYGDWEGFESEQTNLARPRRLRQEMRLGERGDRGDH